MEKGQKQKNQEVAEIIGLVQQGISKGLEKGALGGDLVHINKVTQASIALSGLGTAFLQQGEQIEKLNAEIEELKSKKVLKKAE
jgi:hypothetical protein